MQLIRKPFALVLFLAGLIAGGALTSIATAAQPHMGAALRALNTARGQLNAAEHDKGGHREKALGLIDQAIAEVQAGIAAGRNN